MSLYHAIRITIFGSLIFGCSPADDHNPCLASAHHAKEVSPQGGRTQQVSSRDVSSGIHSCASVRPKLERLQCAICYKCVPVARAEAATEEAGPSKAPPKGSGAKRGKNRKAVVDIPEPKQLCFSAEQLGVRIGTSGYR